MAYTSWEVRTTGSDLNGGGYISLSGAGGGTDYSQQDSAQKSGTDLTMHASTNTKVRPVGAGVAAADVDNVIQIASGTNWTPGFYIITGQDGTYWTLHASPASAGEANTATYKMGGALASPGKIPANLNSNNNLIWIKTGTYTITSASPNVSNGTIKVTANVHEKIEGYGSTRGDLVSPPTLILDSGVSSASIIENSNGPFWSFNLILDGNNQTSSRGIYGPGGSSAYIYKTTFKNFTNSAVEKAQNTVCNLYFCELSGCSSVDIAVFGGQSYWVGCVSHDNNVSGFIVTAAALDCISYNNTGGSSNGFSVVGEAHCFNCSSYGNGAAGFGIVGGANSQVINCHSESNGTYGYLGWDYQAFWLKCTAYGNSSGAYDGAVGAVWIHDITSISGSAFVDAANGNFALNNTANRGALLRAAGFPSAFPGGLTASYPDIGAAQHQEAAGSGKSVIVGGGAAWSVF